VRVQQLRLLGFVGCERRAHTEVRMKGIAQSSRRNFRRWGEANLEDDGTWKLVGINSFSGNPWDAIVNSNGSRGLYGSLGQMTRVSQHADWIYSVIPEPTTTMLLAFCGVGALFLIVGKRSHARARRKGFFEI